MNRALVLESGRQIQKQLRKVFSTSEAKASVNHLAKLYQQASYSYLSLGFYFNWDDVALPRVSGFSHELVKDKQEGTEHFMLLHNQCGDCILLQAMQKPAQEEWGLNLDAMQAALNQALLKLHALGWRQGESHLCDFLESHYLGQKAKPLKCLGHHPTSLCYV
ncbi:ferritin light chain-like [Trichosurus vulpecula]|uniref:ferritin light chain-like n=1 Tax=Trichosurus vulpecula TaxID=9337 RepID=UPI00186B0CD1|nr:ferritin light chain-like [Trichosurus vulpecula]